MGKFAFGAGEFPGTVIFLLETRWRIFRETCNEIQTHLVWMGDYPNSYTGSNDYVLNERNARAFTEHRIPQMVERFRFLKNETVSNEFHAQWRKKC